MIVFIIGPGGAGKTTAGKILADKLNYAFIDLDDRFMEEVGNIAQYISDFGYEKYCFSNSDLFYSKIRDLNENTIFVLSSGFLAHEGLDDLTKKHENDLRLFGKTVMLLPSIDVSACQEIVVERQLNRGFGLEKEKEKKKIISRFHVYKNKGDVRVFSQGTPKAIAEEIIKKLSLLK